MSKLFDDYRSNYNQVVEDSVGFSGLKHDFFLQAKVDVLERVISDRLNASSGAEIRAVDVGCGVGAFHPYVSGLLPRLSGCDISTESIARAGDDNHRVDYRTYDPPKLPYQDNEFDLAFAICVLHHVPPADWSGFVGEMKRIVRTGGAVCIIEHNPFNPLTKLAVLRCPFDEDAVLLRKGKTERLLAESGLKDISSEHFLLFPTAARHMRAIESKLSGFPFGAQYAISASV